MKRSAYTENRFGLQFDPRTKIVLLILCVISATIASSLLYESALVFAITVFGCASGKVRRSLFCMAFYDAFYILTLWIRLLEKGVLYTVFTSWLGLFYTVYPCAFLSSIILSTTKVNEFLTAMNKAHIPKKVLIPLTRDRKSKAPYLPSCDTVPGEGPHCHSSCSIHPYFGFYSGKAGVTYDYVSACIFFV